MCTNSSASCGIPAVVEQADRKANAASRRCIRDSSITVIGCARWSYSSSSLCSGVCGLLMPWQAKCAQVASASSSRTRARVASSSTSTTLPAKRRPSISASSSVPGRSSAPSVCGMATTSSRGAAAGLCGADRIRSSARTVGTDDDTTRSGTALPNPASYRPAQPSGNTDIGPLVTHQTRGQGCPARGSWWWPSARSTGWHTTSQSHPRVCSTVPSA
jgi:hypothetical protein